VLKNDAHDDEALHQNGKDIISPDQHSVKEGRPRYRHGKNKDRGYQYLSRIACSYKKHPDKYISRTEE
jgi:hypothetical protein